MQIHLSRHFTVDSSLTKIIILDKGICDTLGGLIGLLLILILFRFAFALEVPEVVEKL